MYRVLVPFKDLQDGGHVYQSGDTYPRKGATPSKKRIDELSTPSNRRGIPLIESLVLAQGSLSSVHDDSYPAFSTPNGQKAKRGPRKSQDD